MAINICQLARSSPLQVVTLYWVADKAYYAFKRVLDLQWSMLSITDSLTPINVNVDF